MQEAGQLKPPTGWLLYRGEDIPFSLYPDYTVGPGITPGLLSLAQGQALAG